MGVSLVLQGLFRTRQTELLPSYAVPVYTYMYPCKQIMSAIWCSHYVQWCSCCHFMANTDMLASDTIDASVFVVCEQVLVDRVAVTAIYDDKHTLHSAGMC
jgi:hypothetical protein